MHYSEINKIKMQYGEDLTSLDKANKQKEQELKEKLEIERAEEIK